MHARRQAAPARDPMPSKAKPAARGRRKTGTQAAASAADTVEAQAYQQLVQFAKVDTTLKLRVVGDEKGNGLMATRAHKAGQVLMRVPKGVSLVLDYEQGLQVPEGRWPRLREGVSHPEALPWDILLALALMDGLAGDGDQFWSAWCQAVLPPPESLTLPCCMNDTQLDALQDGEVAQAARAQQARLQSLFPHLSTPSQEGACSWLVWGFACVRSRAFRLSDDCHAFLPFLDLANHNQQPNADFRAAGDAYELFAVRDISTGEEVTIRYGGEDGYTNKRWLATYGFVPVGGNPADRVTLILPNSYSNSNSNTATVSASQDLTQDINNLTLSDLPGTRSNGGATGSSAANGSNAASGLSGAVGGSTGAVGSNANVGTGSASSGQMGLSLERMQDKLGDDTFNKGVAGQDPRLQAALRSLPWLPETEDTHTNTTHTNNETTQQGQQASAADSTHTDTGSTGAPLGHMSEDVVLAMHLRDQCRAQLQGFPTTLEQDTSELQRVLTSAANTDINNTNGSTDSSGASASKAVDVAVLRYRIERKELLTTLALVLDIYARR